MFFAPFRSLRSLHYTKNTGYAGVSSQDNLMSETIISPNNWIKKAGGYISADGKLQLPLRDILLPIHHASICIERYEKEKDEPQTMDVLGKMQLIQNIGLNVRAADKAYFSLWSSALIKNSINDQKVVSLFGGCKNCLQASLSPNSLRENVAPKLKALSGLNNIKIIHSMDSGGMIKESDIHVVFDYYNEFLNLNLLQFPEIRSLKKRKCKQCIS